MCVPGVSRQGSFPFDLVASHDALCRVVRSGRELPVFPTVSTVTPGRVLVTIAKPSPRRGREQRREILATPLSQISAGGY